jgi:hypothetical protein
MDRCAQPEPTVIAKQSHKSANVRVLPRRMRSAAS